MASFSADLYVSGQRFPVVQCTYGTDQATDNCGRVMAKVRYGPVQLVLDVPAGDLLLSWANAPQKQLATDIVFRQAAGGGTLETLHMAGAYCVGYQETFASGDQNKGAYQCHLTLVDPTGFTLSAGSPVQALINVPGGLVSVATAAEETGLAGAVAEPVAETVVETTAPTVLGGLARLAALLPELAAAAIVAVFVPTNSRDDPGYKPEWDIIRRNAVVTDKDRAELAYLEQRQQDGTLTAAEEEQLLPLLARVRGLHLQKLSDLRQVVSDFTGVEVVNANNAVLGEFDGINMAEGMFIEDKSADGLNMVNPRTGLPAQTPETWAHKHVFAKTAKRIEGLKQATGTRPTGAGTPTVPSIEDIRNFRRLHFRIEADTPEVQKAVEKELQNLTTTYPNWDFTAQYGN